MKDNIQQLKDARELIVKGGWVQKVGKDGKGGYCALAAAWEQEKAIVPVADFVWGKTSTVRALAQAIPDRMRYSSVDGVAIAEYNDVSGRTQAEIVALFDNAIESLQP